MDRIPLENWSRRESIRRPWRNRKQLNENLAPLLRYLRSNVGRSWDAVYSEICQHINRDSAVQLHIWQHLIQYVCTNPYIVSGNINSYRPLSSFYFYVDPGTGLLRENADCWRRRCRRPAKNQEQRDLVKIDDFHEHRRIAGIWYLVTFKPLAGAGRARDVLLCHDVPSTEEELRATYGRSIYAASKLQLNSRELRKLGLG